MREREGKGRTARRRWSLLAVTALLVIAVGASEAVPSSSAPTAETAAKKKQKKKKGKKKGKKKRGSGGTQPDASDLREVILVGNNWEGTADVIEVRYPPEAVAAEKGKKKGKKGGRKKARGKRRAKRSGAAVAQDCKNKKGKKKGKKGKRGKKKGKKRKRASDCAKPVERPKPTYHRVTRLNIVPDLQERLAEIATNPVDLGYFLAIALLIGEGNHQYVDDLYTTKDGRLLIVSRPSLKDVVAINIKSGNIAWRFEVAGQRSDHMAISPDGKHVAVSASTGNVVHILDTETGEQVGTFPSGDSPHENSYSEDGQRIYHASIGLVYTPLDLPLLDSTKGERVFQVVDAASNNIVKQVDIGQKLAEAGHPDMSSAVRPMAITSDEDRIYMQVSFFHGFVEYDNVNDRVLRVANLPDHYGGSRESYLLDSAHHGIALDGEDRTLCVAGTMSDYAALVDRQNFGDYKLINDGTKPYWSTTSEDGRFCYVSWSGTDSISVIDYETRKVVHNIPVGDHPQRVRSGVVPQSFIDAHK